MKKKTSKNSSSSSSKTARPKVKATLPARAPPVSEKPVPHKEAVHLLIVDAHAMAYRAYYALRAHDLRHPESGMPTHAIHGFFRMFFKALLEHQPQYCAVAWDPAGPTFRNELYSAYKATRKPMPQDLRLQISEIKAMLHESGFVNLEYAGFEADDVMGALTARFVSDMQADSAAAPQKKTAKKTKRKKATSRKRRQTNSVVDQ